MTTTAEPRSLETDPDHVVVRVGDALFAIPLSSLVEVVRPLPVTRLPSPPRGVTGLVAVRDQVLPLLDLGLRLTGRRCEEGARVLVTAIERERSGGSPAEERIAVLVDRVEDVVRLREVELSEPPEGSVAGQEEYLRGVTRVSDRVVAVLGKTALVIDQSNGAEAGYESR